MSRAPSREEALFVDALAQPPAERGAFLARACGANADLLAHVVALVAAHDGADSVLESPAYRAFRRLQSISHRRTPRWSPPSFALTPDAHADEAKLAVGAVINGRYTVLRAIAHGGMGWVYDVADALHPDRAVALKTVMGLGPSAATSLFKTEFATMTKLDHPNVARVYDFEQIQGSDDFVMTMERIDGVPLSAATKGARNWRPVVENAVQVCRALSYMHSRRIVHFDLKPANILVTTAGRVKVVDFGIAGTQPAGLEGGVLGTPQYMAPELLFGNGSADHRADLYSLGMTLYELLLGHMPWRSRDLFELAAQRNRRGVVLPDDSGVPEWLARIVEKLCALDPADRPRNANAVVQAINGGGFDYQLETLETRQSYVMSPRFTGRTGVYAQIVEFLSRRLRGESEHPVLMLAGLSGIGKSRLMREVRYAAQMQRMVFLESDCYEHSLVEFGPVADILHQLVPLVEALGGLDLVYTALPELVKIAPRLAHGRTFVESVRAADDERERARLLESTGDFLVRAARLVPFAIYVNDMQWAGHGSAELFSQLAQRVSDDEANGQRTSLALVGSYRSDELEGCALEPMLATLRKRTLAIEIELQPLTGADVGQVVRSMLGVEDVPAEFLDRITEETAGNPFFVQEVMRVLFENGSVFLDDGKWATTSDVGALQIPAGIAGVFRRRLGLLESDEQDVVRTLAVHGRPLPLARVIDLFGSERAGRALIALEEKTMVVKVAGSGVLYNIAHDRMRETIYADLSVDDRRARHAQLAMAFEEAARGVPLEDQPLDELARHYWEARVTDKALAYALGAGRRAMENYSNESAAEHFEHACALLPPDDPRFAETLESHADMLVRLSRYEVALNRYDALLAALRGRPADEARIHCKAVEVHTSRMELALAIERGWQALALYGEPRPRSNVGWLCGTISNFCYFVLARLGVMAAPAPMPDAAQRVAVYDKLYRAYFFFDIVRTFYCTLRIWRLSLRAGDPVTKACGSASIAMMIGIAGMRRWAYQLFEHARAQAELAASRWWVGSVEFRRAIVVRMDGNWERAGIDRGVEALRDVGNLFDLSGSIYHVADIELFTGHVARALEVVRPFNAAAMRVSQGVPPPVLGTLNIEAQCRALRDDPGFEAVHATVIESATRNKDALIACNTLHRYGESLVNLGRVSEGIEKIEQACELWERKHLLDNYSAELLHKLPRAYLACEQLTRGQERRLKKVHRTALRQTRKVHANYRAPVLVNEALLLERRGRQKRCDAAFTRAIEIARHQNADYFVADALYAWGRVLCLRGERAAGHARVAEALSVAERGGNLSLARRCRDVMTKLALPGAT
jgi:tetratricopeptide (TPR) repeat protein